MFQDISKQKICELAKNKDFHRFHQNIMSTIPYTPRANSGSALVLVNGGQVQNLVLQIPTDSKLLTFILGESNSHSSWMILFLPRWDDSSCVSSLVISTLIFNFDFSYNLVTFSLPPRPKTRNHFHQTPTSYHQSPQEATEVSPDPEARFFPFTIDMHSIFIMEKKGLPNHLAGLPFVDVPTTLGSILTNLEDAGEAGHEWIFQVV